MPTRNTVYGNRSMFNYDISDERREEYRRSSEEARSRKNMAISGEGPEPLHPINTPALDPKDLMPMRRRHRLRSLSLFSGGGGLDLGFDRAGYRHVASYDLIQICGETIRYNRPKWDVHAGPDDGDVKRCSWNHLTGKVDVIHGGPPCQPFSIAGQQKGVDDDRNMWGEFVRAINTIKPAAFVGENVMGLMDPKFDRFIDREILKPLVDYRIIKFELSAADFGVPQARRRVFFVGFRQKEDFESFTVPLPTHNASPHTDKYQGPDLFESINPLPVTFGVRQALGLPDNGTDALAPTLRSGFTGKRNTTSILNSKASELAWAELGIWGSGVQADRESAHRFVVKNGDFRLSVQDCGILQGFPEDWGFKGAVYQIIGQIGNSVAPPVGYAVADAVRKALL